MMEVMNVRRVVGVMEMLMEEMEIVVGLVVGVYRLSMWAVFMFLTVFLQTV